MERIFKKTSMFTFKNLFEDIDKAKVVKLNFFISS